MKKPTVLKEQRLKDDTIIESLSDGTTRIVDSKGKAINTLQVTNEQIEEWKKMPRDKALKVIIELFQANNIDVPEAKYKLDVFKLLCDISGATVPAIQTQNIIAVKISVAPLPVGMKPIDIQRV